MAHCYRWEGGGAAVLGSVQSLSHQSDGCLAWADIEDAIKPGDIHLARTRLLALENTLGGKLLPFACGQGANRLFPRSPFVFDVERSAMPDPILITPQEALLRTIEHREIFHDEMLHIVRQIMSGALSPVMMAALITGLRVKKETIGEITAAAQVMRELSTKVHVADKTHLVDIVGTGGDSAHTFNISTCAMFVAAAAGARVSKHGGRGVTSKSGSADVMEALGVNIQLSPKAIEQCIAQLGVGFMFAPNHHTAMKNVAPVRKELGIKTIFNLLGPLTNPAGAPNILMGVFHPDLVGIQVRVLQRLGAEHAVVVYGEDGIDEISLGASTRVGELKDGRITEYEIHPQDFGLATASHQALRVDTPEASKAMLLGVLDNQPGPALEIVVLNAGVALYAANVTPTMAEGVARSREAIRLGAAREKLTQLVQATQAYQAA
jgi:anthranilate phosphoribosyltransferase